ncbi:hypothetical protein ES703_25845 [subsurface metagenome]
MDSISDFFKKLCISAKDKEVQKILDQIPDQSSKEQYFYNWFTEQWNLLGGMKEKQNFLFDGNRNLKVVDIISVPLHYTKFIEGKGLITAGYIEIDSAPYTIKSFSFLTGKLQGDNFKILIRYYNDKWQNCNVDKEITFTEPSVMEIPVIPNCKFYLLFFTEVDYYFDIDVYANFFFKGISDEIYGDSWNEIKTIGASKNVLYDKINAMDTLIDANTTPAEAISAMGVKANDNPLHHDRTTEYTDDEAISAMGVKANDNPLHHDRTTEYTDDEAVSAMGVKADDNPLHHNRTTKYTDGEAVSAMGDKADDNPLHHDQTKKRAKQVWSGSYIGDGTNNRPIGKTFNQIKLIIIFDCWDGGEIWYKYPELNGSYAQRHSDRRYSYTKIEIYNGGTSFKISDNCNDNGNVYRYMVYCD